MTATTASQADPPGSYEGAVHGTTLILIHHIDARSGIECVTPVAFSPQEGGRFAIWAEPADPERRCR